MWLTTQNSPRRYRVQPGNSTSVPEGAKRESENGNIRHLRLQSALRHPTFSASGSATKVPVRFVTLAGTWTPVLAFRKVEARVPRRQKACVLLVVVGVRVHVCSHAASWSSNTVNIVKHGWSEAETNSIQAGAASSYNRYPMAVAHVCGTPKRCVPKLGMHLGAGTLRAQTSVSCPLS
ncbi:hypothetical protein CH063_06921, partial [Colletotrichum higginsianum]